MANEDLDKVERVTGNLAAIRFWAAITGVVGLIGAFFIRGAPEGHDGKKCTLTIHAALAPSQTREMITVEVRKSGGFNSLHNRSITSGTLELGAGRTAGTLHLHLPGAGNVVYIVKSSTSVTVHGLSLNGVSQENEQPLCVNGDTTLYLVRDVPEYTAMNPAAAFVFRATLTPERPAGSDPFSRIKPPPQQPIVGSNPLGGGKAPTQLPGVLLLRIGTPLLDGVDAWVEIDGKRAANWKVKTTELKLPLPAGTYQVAVRSIYEGVKRTFFDSKVTIAARETKDIFLGQ
jgi:hypothetical protein